MRFKVGDKVESSWWNCEHGKRGVVSGNFQVTRLHGEQLKYWKRNFTLVKWDLDGFESGELTRYLSKVDE